MTWRAPRGLLAAMIGDVLHTSTPRVQNFSALTEPLAALPRPPAGTLLLRASRPGCDVELGRAAAMGARPDFAR